MVTIRVTVQPKSAVKWVMSLACDHTLCLNAGMATLELNKGYIAHIDDEDESLVADRNWHTKKVSGRVYAVSKQMRDGRVTVTFLHRLIAGADRERITFRNGDTLDCRKENLAQQGTVRGRKSFEVGAIAEARVIADLTAHGHDAFVPVGGHTAADLVSIQPDGQTVRWQVKARQMTKSTKSIRISLSAVHPKRGGYARKPYDLSKIDGFAVYSIEPEGIYYVPVSAVDQDKQSFSLCFGPNAHCDASKNGLDYLSPNIMSQFPTQRLQKAR